MLRNGLSGVLCLTMLVLPFSIAASNVLFGLLIVVGLFSGVWWQGAKAAWRQWPVFFYGWAAYFSLMLAGLGWSQDVNWGLHILPQYWAWLLLPVLVALLQDAIWRRRWLFCLSLGLFLQLLVCIAQSWGVKLPVGNGSSAGDPAGFIGHIGFGLIYGIWAAWLMHFAHVDQGKRVWRWLARSAAVASLVMIFIVQGRSGYVVALCLLGFIAWQLYLRQLGWKLLWWALPVVLLAVTVFSMGGAADRLQLTLNSLRAFEHMDFSAAEERVSLMYAGIQTWLEHPLLGAGTGSYPVTAMALQQAHPELGLHYAAPGVAPSSPHNFYIMMLARWGVPGLMVLLFLFYQWWSLGMRQSWNKTHGSMLALSAVAVSVHAMTALPFEEYYSSVFSVLWISAGLAGIVMEERGGETQA